MPSEASSGKIQNAHPWHRFCSSLSVALFMTAEAGFWCGSGRVAGAAGEEAAGRLRFRAVRSQRRTSFLYSFWPSRNHNLGKDPVQETDPCLIAKTVTKGLLGSPLGLFEVGIMCRRVEEKSRLEMVNYYSVGARTAASTS